VSGWDFIFMTDSKPGWAGLTNIQQREIIESRSLELSVGWPRLHRIHGKTLCAQAEAEERFAVDSLSSHTRMGLIDGHAGANISPLNEASRRQWKGLRGVDSCRIERGNPSAPRKTKTHRLEGLFGRIPKN